MRRAVLAAVGVDGGPPVLRRAEVPEVNLRHLVSHVAHTPLEALETDRAGGFWHKSGRGKFPLIVRTRNPEGRFTRETAARCGGKA